MAVAPYFCSEANKWDAQTFSAQLLASFLLYNMYTTLTTAARARTWPAIRKLCHVFSCDARAAPLCYIAPSAKLALLLLFPSFHPYAILASEACEWIRVASAHWLVGDVVGSKPFECDGCVVDGGSGGDGVAKPRTLVMSFKGPVVKTVRAVTDAV
ncbi:hypothetical protein HK101_012010 [Irineochytrium annulatum]|nr:hypothetical protein HK101_012010 [Irineochytrium annulatum]